MSLNTQQILEVGEKGLLGIFFQTVHNVTATRVVGTQVVNTTSLPIFVSIQFTSAVSATILNTQILVGADILSEINIGTSVAGDSYVLTWIVPPSSDYTFKNNGDAITVQNWIEIY